MQLQGGIKYGWYPKYLWLSMLVAIPLSWFYLKSVQHFVKAFEGEIWPSRLLGFSLGIITFTLMSGILFKEPFTAKTIVSVLLGFTIVAIQVLWR
jgi:NO-binding membrane sensor protein with MHYT domain